MTTILYHCILINNSDFIVELLYKGQVGSGASLQGTSWEQSLGERNSHKGVLFNTPHPFFYNGVSKNSLTLDLLLTIVSDKCTITMGSVIQRVHIAYWGSSVQYWGIWSWSGVWGVTLRFTGT